jgi:thiamine pyrophosphate-dependent acetolactate synthase large subunit-like protein
MSGLDRRAVVARLLEGRRDLVVVAGLGAPAYDVAAAGDHDRDFPLWGAMGGAVPIGLGLALARPELPVLVVTGDGEMLMGMGSLATVAARAPGNLVIVVLDNGVYGETGNQKSHTALGTDLAAVARGCGIEDFRRLSTMDEVAAFAPRVHTTGPAPAFACIPVDPAPVPKVFPPRDGPFLKNRLRGALGAGAHARNDGRHG